jgi:cytochrome P450
MTSDLHVPAAPVYAPGRLPLLGHVVSLLRDPLGLLASLPGRGDLVGVEAAAYRAAVVCDPALIRQVLLYDQVYDKGGPLIERGREVIGNGLVTCPRGQHRRQRRLVQPAFHHDRLPGYAQVMTREVAEHRAGWRDGQVVEVLRDLPRLTGRILLRTMFSDVLPGMRLDQVLDDFNTLLSTVYRQTVLPPVMRRLPLPANRRYRRARDRVGDILGAVLTDRRMRGGAHDDLLSVLLAARDADGTCLSDDEITDQVVTFFGAGADTAATTLAFALRLCITGSMSTRSRSGSIPIAGPTAP